MEELRWLLSIAFVGSFASCVGDAPLSDPPSATIQARVGSFYEFYELTDSIVLEQSDTVIIARVSGIDVREDGTLLVGDASESNVKVFDKDGTLLRVIGRGGSGPGEFGQPRYPRFGPDGNIHVADVTHNHISVFDSLGEYLRTVPLFQFSLIMNFWVLPDGDYLLTASLANSDSSLFRVDSVGTIQRSYLAKARMRALDSPAEGIWRTVTQQWLGVRRDTAFVVNTVSDSLWAVSLSSGEISATRLAFDGYKPPTFPEVIPRGPRGLMEWIASFHIAATIGVDSTQIVVPFVRGVLNYGDPMTLLVGDSLGEWRALNDGPPIIYSAHGALIGLLTPNEDAVIFGRFRRRL